MGCSPLISFDYQGTEPPELSRTRILAPSMPRPLDASHPHWLDRDALTLIGILPRCLAHIMPRCLAHIMPRCLAHIMPRCLNASRSSEALRHDASRSSEALSLAIIRASCLALIARHSEARCLATLARLANQITLLAVGVFIYKVIPQFGSPT